MAKQVQAVLVDDFDGGAADNTVFFGLDGVNYEIELNIKHVDELAAILEPYIKAGRKVSAPKKAGRKTSGKSHGTSDAAAIRVWAEGKGISLRTRGRVPASVVAQYRAATGA